MGGCRVAHVPYGAQPLPVDIFPTTLALCRRRFRIQWSTHPGTCSTTTHLEHRIPRVKSGRSLNCGGDSEIEAGLGDVDQWCELFWSLFTTVESG